MKELSGSHDVIAMADKQFGHRFHIRQSSRVVRIIGVNASRPGTSSRHDGGSRRPAHGCRAMSFGEEDSAPSQRIHMRSLYLWVSVKATDPVIQIVDRDEQDIGAILRTGIHTANDHKGPHNRQCTKARKHDELDSMDADGSANARFWNTFAGAVENRQSALMIFAWEDRRSLAVFTSSAASAKLLLDFNVGQRRSEGRMP